MEEIGVGIIGWLLKLLGLAARSMVWLVVAAWEYLIPESVTLQASILRKAPSALTGAITWSKAG
jgi:hypothetical protein